MNNNSKYSNKSVDFTNKKGKLEHRISDTKNIVHVFEI